MTSELLPEELRSRDIDTIEIGFADTQGVLRGKRVPLHQLTRVAQRGLPFCLGALGWDIQGTVFPTEIVGWENGYPDAVAVPDLTTLRYVPWRDGTALVLADIVDETRQPIRVSTREVLKRVLREAAKSGLSPQVGVELEFHVLDENWQPVYGGNQAYSLSHAGRLEVFFRDLRNKLQIFGIPVEASHSEYGPAQSEVNLVYTNALAAADNAVLFKYAVKEVARHHDLRATFMAKPWDNQSGNGLHLHISYTELDGAENVFFTRANVAQNAVAGLLDVLGDFAALWAPTVNSFKRVREDSFVPTTRSWGGDNRTVAVRALLDRGPDSRIELRAGASDANPYVAIAAAVAGSLHGIKNKLEPPAVTVGNAAQCSSVGRLPTSLGSALTQLEASHTAAQYFDAQFLRHYASTSRFDLKVHEQTVSDWERERYLENS